MSIEKKRVFSAAKLRFAALGAALILVVAINLLWLWLDRRATDEADWVDHTHQVIAVLQEMLARSTDMVIGQRGYALTHEADFLEPYQTATNRMPALVQSLQQLVANNPAQLRRAEQLAPLLAQHEAVNREHIAALVKGDVPATDLVFRRKIKDSIEGIRSLVQEMIGEENNLLAQRRDALAFDGELVTLASVASALVSIALLLGVFTALWRENARRREVEAQLKDLVRQRTASLNMSEERLRLAQQAARIGAFEWNVQTGVNTWTPELEAMYGLPPGGFPQTQTAWEKLVHPDDRAEAVARVQQAVETGVASEGEWRVLWPDGSLHWLFGRFQTFKDESGKLLALTGVNIDITERKRLEREILEASDSEMRRIGHDLHDGVGQQLTALSLFVTSQQKEVPSDAPQLVESCKKISHELREIIRQIRVLSHGLSPVSLEENGLAEALRKLAADTRSVAGMDCEFADATSGANVDPQVAAQFYRIGQEAVANALKHSRAKKISVTLDASATLIRLKVSDDGRGFVNGKSNGSGLGLRAMKYRANLIGATLQIDSTNKGTQISCSIHKSN